MKLVYTIILFFLFLPALANAGADSSVYIHYNITNGLPSNNVYMCLQDHLGYMWFATEKGVVKYNGYEYKVFNTADGLSNADVWKLQEDSKGRIWVYSISHEFGYIKNDKYHVLNLPKSERVLYPSRVVDLKNGKTCFLFSTNAMYTHGVCFVGDTSVAVRFYYPYLNNIYSKLIIGDEKLYWLTDNKVYEMDITEEKTHKLELKCAISDFSFITSESTFDVYHERYFPFKVKPNQINFIDTRNCSIQKLYIENLNHDKRESYYVNLDRNNWFTFITNKGIYSIDSNLKVVFRESLATLPPKLSQVSYRYQDSNGNKWYTTLRDGVVEKKPYHILFEPFHMPDVAKYIGTVNNGCSGWWNDQTRELYFVGLKGVEKKLKISEYGTLRHISQWTDSSYCLSFSKGIYLMNVKKSTIKPLLENKELILKNYRSFDKNRIAYDSVKKLILTNPICTYYFNKDNIYTLNFISMDRLSVGKDTVISERIEVDRYINLLYDSILSALYVYNNETLMSYNVATKTFVNLSKQLAAFPKRIVSVQMDAIHNLYIQSETSIYRYNPVDKKFTQLEFNISLTDVVFKIYDNKIIVCGKFGVLVATIVPFSEYNKPRYFFNDNVYNQVTDAVVSNGRLFLKTDQGYKTVLLDKIILQGKIFDKRNVLFRLLLKDTSLRNLVGGDTITLAPGKKNVSFNTINLNGKGQVVYKYRVKEISDSWVQSQGDIFFENMLADRYYTLEVIIRDDNWKSNSYFLTVYRSPYWYQTVKGKIVIWGSVIFISVLLMVVTIYITRRYVAKANEKKQKLTDLELRAIHSQINPHFIFNTLSTALYFINRNEMEAAYTHVNKFSHLLRSYLKSSQERYISLDEEIEMLRRYIELQQSRFGDEFEFILSVDNKLPINHMKIPSLLLQPLVENAINHGLFHKKGKGQLKIDFKQGRSNDEMICTIEDNGVGRKVAGAINMANEFKKESYGSKLTQGLIDIFEQYEQMNIDISYVDKQAPETGTIVKLVIKNIKYETTDQ